MGLLISLPVWGYRCGRLAHVEPGLEISQVALACVLLEVQFGHAGAQAKPVGGGVAEDPEIWGLTKSKGP